MLRKADVIVIREEEAEELKGFIDRLKEGDRRPSVWTIRRNLQIDRTLARPLAFCGIARPENFTAMLAAKGYGPVETVAFPDHHAYSARDITRLIEKARKHNADGLITTEKDAVKLTPAMRKQLETAGPLLVARLNVELTDEQEALLQLITLCERLDRRLQKR